MAVSGATAIAEIQFGDYIFPAFDQVHFTDFCHFSVQTQAYAYGFSIAYSLTDFYSVPKLFQYLAKMSCATKIGF